MKMTHHTCSTCGGDLIKNDASSWVCKYCGNIYEDETVQKNADLLRQFLDEYKLEKVANLRRNLYDALIEENPSRMRICSFCDSIKEYLPNDFMANFFYTAVTQTPKAIAAALREVNVIEQKNYVDIIVSFCARNVTRESSLPLMNLIERAYKNTDLARFEYYATLVSDEMVKVDSGTYSTILPRDAFIAYSSKDIAKVEELVELLEENKFSCFVAARNLRHGRDAVENYQHALEEAMDNCKTIIFVSSLASRNTECDALKYELSYIKKKDIENSPHEYRQDYTQIPKNYKKPRIEYRIQNSTIFNAADSVTNEFFKGYEFTLSPRAVAERLALILSEFSSATQPKDDASSKPALSPAESFLERANIFLADGFWEKADEYCEKALDIDPSNANAYLIKLLASKRLTSKKELVKLNESLDFDPNFKNALTYASKDLKAELKGYADAINSRIGEKNRQIQELAQKKARIDKEIAAAEAEKAKIEGAKKDIEAKIANHSVSLAALQGVINEKREKLKRIKLISTPFHSKFFFAIALALIISFALIFILCTLSISEALPSEIDSVIRDIMLNIVETPETLGTIVLVILAISIIVMSFIFMWTGGFSAFFSTLLVAVPSNFAGYLILMLIINNPFRMIGEMLSTLFGLLGKMELKKDGSDILSMSILVILNLLIAIICYLRVTKKSTNTKKDMKTAKKELAKAEQKYNTLLYSNAELDVLNKKLKETDLLYQRSVSAWQTSIMDMCQDYIRTAKEYSLSQDIRVPSWIVNK